MPTPYETLAPSLRPGHPKERCDEISEGSHYVYRATTSVITANKPDVGDVWADGRPVVFREVYELSAASGISDLQVVTGVNYGVTGVIGTVLDEIAYEITWRPLIKPLEVHPDFQTGGTYALNATARKHIIGWRAELDPELKSARQYRPLDSYGDPSGTIETITGNAVTFISLLEIGVEEWTDYMPIWRKRSFYRGTSGPSTGSPGGKGTPSGAGYPSGYEWVKSKDDARRVGRSSKWERDEEWEGAITVYADISTIYPP